MVAVWILNGRFLYHIAPIPIIKRIAGLLELQVPNEHGRIIRLSSCIFSSSNEQHNYRLWLVPGSVNSQSH